MTLTILHERTTVQLQAKREFVVQLDSLLLVEVVSKTVETQSEDVRQTPHDHSFGCILFGLACLTEILIVLVE